LTTLFCGWTIPLKKLYSEKKQYGPCWVNALVVLNNWAWRI
jgi:hypothetical protein